MTAFCLTKIGTRHAWIGALIFAWVGLVAGLPSTSSAQYDPAFSRIDLRLARAQNLANNDGFFRYWRPGYGFEGSLSTPFYFGVAETGLAWHVYNADDPQVPRMQAFHLHVGWGVPLRTGPLTWLGGFRLGNYNMNFDVETDFASERQESEFSMSVFARAEIDLTKHLGLSAGASRTTVFTKNRLYFNYLQAGLVLRIPTGEGFQRALR